jgi:hypothetical protein
MVAGGEKGGGKVSSPAWFRIIAPHFVAGGEFKNGHAAKCASIIKYMVHWTPEAIRDYCATKRWTLEEYND